ncbi:hypothetical protein BC829DRAFT_384025 [Chytridium lagenaria]|nr:hypothetical protein BC829DRAFT_384025 [Chytridium lagenaria]
MSGSSGISIQVLPPSATNGSQDVSFVSGFPGVSDFHINGRLLIRNKSRVPRSVHSITVALTGITITRFVNSRSFPAEEHYQRRKHLNVESAVPLDPIDHGVLQPNACIDLAFDIRIPESLRIIPSCSVAASAKNFLTNDAVLPNGGYQQKAISWLSCDSWYELSAKMSLSDAAFIQLLESPVLKLPFGLISPVEPAVVQAYANPQHSIVLKDTQESLSLTVSLPSVLRPNTSIRCVVAAREHSILKERSRENLTSGTPNSPISIGSTSPAAQPFSPRSSPTLMPGRPRRFSNAESPTFSNTNVEKGGRLQVTGVKLDLVQNCRVTVRENTAIVSSIVHSHVIPHYVVSEMGKPQAITFDVPMTAPTTTNPEYQISYYIRSTFQFSPRRSISFSPIPPILISSPITIATYSRDTAEHASTDAPWLFLPVSPSLSSSPRSPTAPTGIRMGMGTPPPPLDLDDAEEEGRAVPLPPRCWRLVGDVAGDLPSYREVLGDIPMPLL